MAITELKIVREDVICSRGRGARVATNSLKKEVGWAREVFELIQGLEYANERGIELNGCRDGFRA